MTNAPKHSSHRRKARRQDGKDGPARPIVKKEEVQKSNDEHIDQDFPGFPNHPSKEQAISNGSASAFEGTENPGDDEDKDDLYYK